MNNKNNFQVYDGLNLMWSDDDGKTYMVAVKQDDQSLTLYDDFCFAADMYCWHRRYNIGVEHKFSSPQDFWINAVEKYVPEEEQINYALEGKIEGMHLIAHEDDTYNMSFDEYPDIYYEKEPKWKTLQLIQNELSNKDCETLLYPYVEWMPVWMYDHSGQTIRCGENNPFCDRFDSGQIGLVIISKQTMLSEFKCTENDWRERAREIMTAEVEEYDEFIQGNIFGYFMYEFVGDADSDISDWDNWEEYDPSVWGFIGSSIYENGMLDSIGCGLQKAIEAERYDEVPDFEVSMF